mmetsp:Transcript_14831/g.29931  ORF Transcript_14831/g.29931 Transcript_14831/m.29931 type:complete len:163 (+) Transcript_14831:952-1440(+)
MHATSPPSSPSFVLCASLAPALSSVSYDCMRREEEREGRLHSLSVCHTYSFLHFFFLLFLLIASLLSPHSLQLVLVLAPPLPLFFLLSPTLLPSPSSSLISSSLLFSRLYLARFFPFHFFLSVCLSVEELYHRLMFDSLTFYYCKEESPEKRKTIGRSKIFG